MDFFAQQDQARKKTKFLVVYFILAVVGIIASIYLVTLPFFGETKLGNPLWDPMLLTWVVLGTLTVVAIGSFSKTAQLSSGGGAVARALGGRLIGTDTKDPDERKLRNVVEEMAIASGVPVPDIYVMDEETGINAFAAGHSPSDAAIGVTRGCMTLLSRDELQGVIAHEFSHILNGDMRLNLRLIGIIFGILCLTIIGRILLRAGSSGRGKKSQGTAAIVILGLALFVIGYIGVFFGKLIQAAVSRQREFLADASAVQFTRNPAGISGALQKIGGAGSRLASAHAEEASHMFFGNGLKQSMFGSLATHPPLDVRIKAIDPSWDGNFKHPKPLKEKRQPSTQKPGKASQQHPFPKIPGMPETQSGGAGLALDAVATGAVLSSLGNPTQNHLRYAEDMRDSFPESIRTAVRKPLDAAALVYAILLSPDESMREKQLSGLATQAAIGVADQTAAFYPEVAPIASRARLPLVNLALPAFRELSTPEYEQFRAALKWLIESDEEIDLFEYVLQKIIRRHLAPHFSKTKPVPTQYYVLKPLLPDLDVVLSTLANLSSDDEAEAEKAFQAGLPHLKPNHGGIQRQPHAQTSLEAFDKALDRLAQSIPFIKMSAIKAALHVVGADGVIHEQEAELLRAIADTLDCPIPPFVQSETA